MEDVHRLLEDVSAVYVRTHGTTEEVGFVSVLVEAHETEAISDRLVARFGASNVFRLISLAVEATLPAVTELEKESPEEGDSGPAETKPRRISREELRDDVAQASRLTGTYLVMVALSTVVAAVALIRDDVAILIGAMVIAPLLGPNVALSLAATLGDVALAKRSLRAIGAGVATALSLSLLAGLVLEVDATAPALAARTRPDVADVFLALASGAAGALAFTSGVPSVVVGVMVAVALLPPLVVIGLLVGSGHPSQAAGALVLVLTNVTCLNLTGVATFAVQKVIPRTWWEADRARRSTRMAVIVWILMLAALVTLLMLNRIAV